MSFQSRWRKTRSRSSPRPRRPRRRCGRSRRPLQGSALRMSWRRTRSSSSSRRETPTPSPFGTKTTKRPGSEISVVSRAPFVFIGSFTAWTRISWPRLIRSWIRLPCRLPFELGRDDLVDVEEAVLLEADLDECGLHAGEHVVDDALVDVAGDRAPLGTLEVDLGDPVVLEDGDSLLGDVDGDEQLALRGGERLARRLPAPLLLLRPARPARLLLVLASRLGRGLGRRRLGRGHSLGLRRRLGGFLDASATAATASAAAGLRRIARGGGLLLYGCCGCCRGCGSGSPNGRLLVRLFRRNQGRGKSSLLEMGRASRRRRLTGAGGAACWEKHSAFEPSLAA